MKTIIAGSRDFTDYKLAKEIIKESGFDITEIFSGNARGADSLGEQYAEENDIPLKIFKAKWDVYGKRAGLLRNVEMAKEADALIAFCYNNSTGTKHMIQLAKSKGLKVFAKHYFD